MKLSGGSSEDLLVISKILSLELRFKVITVLHDESFTVKRILMKKNLSCQKIPKQKLSFTS